MLIFLIANKPSAYYQQNNPDWAPSLNFGYSTGGPYAEVGECHFNRLQSRIKRRQSASACDGQVGAETHTGQNDDATSLVEDEVYSPSCESVSSSSQTEVLAVDIIKIHNVTEEVTSARKTQSNWKIEFECQTKHY